METERNMEQGPHVYNSTEAMRIRRETLERLFIQESKRWH